jgi:hypothetical protein
MGLMLRTVLVVAIGLSAIFPACASSGDSWQVTRQKVHAGCLAKAASMSLGKVEVSVDPFGTQHFGTAILIKRGSPRQLKLAYICVMDKKTGEVEVGGELTL